MEKISKMVSKTPITKLDAAGPPFNAKSFFGYNKLNKFISTGEKLDSEKIQGNIEMIDQEIESLQMILNELELKVYDGIAQDLIEVTDEKEREKLRKLVKFSLIPQCA